MNFMETSIPLPPCVCFIWMVSVCVETAKCEFMTALLYLQVMFSKRTSGITLSPQHLKYYYE